MSRAALFFIDFDFVAACLNDRFRRCTIARAWAALRQGNCCERAHQYLVGSGSGSNPPLAAPCTNDRYADKAAIGHFFGYGS